LVGHDRVEDFSEEESARRISFGQLPGGTVGGVGQFREAVGLKALRRACGRPTAVVWR
jgi:hypothetical protein